MKRRFYLIIFLILVISLISISVIKININSKKIAGLSVEAPTSIVMPGNTVEVVFERKPYWVSWIKVEEIDKLFLYPNLIEKEITRRIIERDKCKSLVNGGFYTKDDRPLGLFITEGKEIRSVVKNFLANGIFFVSYDGEIDIVSYLPNKRMRFAVQTGPLLLENGSLRRLYIRSDKPARRIIASLTGEGDIVFLAVYDKYDPLNGPFLSHLPEILEDFQKQTDFKLSEAVNLDGGTASSFYSPFFFLEELNYVGGYFCIR